MAVEQATVLASWSKYPPTGNRGFCAAGGHTNFTSVPADATAAFTNKANEENLAISLGCAGDLMGDRLNAAITKVAAVAKKHGKIFGMHAPDGLL